MMQDSVTYSTLGGLDLDLDLDLDIANLRRFALSGGPDHADIRGYQALIMSVWASITPPPSSEQTNPRLMSSNRSSPPSYDTGTLADLRDAFIHGINYADLLGDNEPVRPNDFAAVRQGLRRDRDGILAWDGAKVQAFRAATRPYKLKTWQLADELPGGTGDPTTSSSGFRHGRKARFENRKPFANNLPTPAPDWYWGAETAAIPLGLRDALNEYIVPLSPTRSEPPFAPNLFLEIGEPNSRRYGMQARVLHNGAVGVRAIHNLEIHRLGCAAPIGEVKCIVAMYTNETLSLYSFHQMNIKRVTEGDRSGSQPCYVSTMLCAYGMNDDEFCCRGVLAFRNAMDFTSGVGNAAIRGAGERS
ncbi:hypothetical protein BDV95DRAFT_155747 [Massariosphaeria phaeospora]|uniref:Uncharacterized protein n=1 Tax=Massariosphaeria phaeospora TaxID=100035 RepID=A0A7C8IEL8_9PLEO|nr:hypothetical protein BDV95DRAFT_155747 [Massariosphaeria phaeospora]